MRSVPTIEQAMADPGIHNLTKDILMDVLDRQADPLDAYYDVQLAADILKTRLDVLLGPAVARR